jgi:hypothetical protein
MYRIMQSLERESSSNISKSAIPAEQTALALGMAGIEGVADDEKNPRRSNPRKYLLYRPSFAQIALYLATCFKDISDNSALLLYISADGSKRQSQSNGNNHGPFN